MEASKGRNFVVAPVGCLQYEDLFRILVIEKHISKFSNLVKSRHVNLALKFILTDLLIVHDKFASITSQERRKKTDEEHYSNTGLSSGD